MSFSPAEIVGYIASLFVLVSFLMKDIKKLRLINSIGCMLFVIYGVLLNFSIPIVLTNTAILIINTIALLKKPS